MRARLNVLLNKLIVTSFNIGILINTILKISFRLCNYSLLFFLIHAGVSRMDVRELGRNYVMFIEIPGVGINDIRVEVDDQK